MQWYKHSTNSHDDPDISDAMDEFGHSAYTTFFITLEIYGSEYNHLDLDGWLTISKRFLSRKLRLSLIKVEQILNFYSTRNRIIIKTSETSISINCPKYIEIASNWTKRKDYAPTEVLQRTTVAPTAKEEKKKRRRIEKKKNIITKNAVMENIFLSDNELQSLKNDYGDDIANKAINYLSGYKIEKNYKTESDYLTIKRWVIDAVNKNGGNGNGTTGFTANKKIYSERDARNAAACDEADAINRRHAERLAREHVQNTSNGNT